MEPKTINDLTDAELARMVRQSIYAKNTRFGSSDRDARFLLVLAVPYGQDDFPEDGEPIQLPDAIDAFARLLQDEDWAERSFQVYDHAGKPGGLRPVLTPNGATMRESVEHFYAATREDL